MMRKVQGVSFPRSGHHLLIRDLISYFGPRSGSSSDGAFGMNIYERLSLFSKTYRNAWQHFPASKKNAFVYCEYYSHCNNIPCINPHNTFQKSHDFHLDLPRNDQLFYLVQIREPLPAIISWFELSLKHEFPRQGLEEEPADTKEYWHKFYAKKLEFYFGFLEKWILPGENDNLIIIDYDDYTTNRLASLKKILSFIEPGKEVDMWHLEKSLEQLKTKRTTKNFRHLDPFLSEKTERLTSTIRSLKRMHLHAGS